MGRKLRLVARVITREDAAMFGRCCRRINEAARGRKRVIATFDEFIESPTWEAAESSQLD
jgi:hypothetical protein